MGRSGGGRFNKAGAGRGGRMGGPGGGKPGQFSSKRKERLPRSVKPVRNRLPADTIIDYKNLGVLQKFISDRGKIVSRRISGVSAKDQRKITTAIKHARFMGLLPSGGVRK